MRAEAHLARRTARGSSKPNQAQAMNMIHAPLMIQPPMVICAGSGARGFHGMAGAVCRTRWAHEARPACCMHACVAAAEAARCMTRDRPSNRRRVRHTPRLQMRRGWAVDERVPEVRTGGAHVVKGEAGKAQRREARERQRQQRAQRHADRAEADEERARARAVLARDEAGNVTAVDGARGACAGPTALV